MAKRTLVALATTLVAGGCAHSPPTQFLTLDADAPARVRADYAGPPIRLAAVTLPASLDRPEWVGQDLAGVLRISPDARWGAPLGRLVRDTLIRDLIARLPEGTVLPPDAPPTSNTATLSMVILSLSGRTGTAVLDAEYRLGPPMEDGWHALRVASAEGTGPVAAAQAISCLLGRVADQLAAGLPATGGLRAEERLPSGRHMSKR